MQWHYADNGENLRDKEKENTADAI